jgi:5-methylcytosine-specific restriction endonuclease McrA
LREDWAPATGPEYADYLRRLRAERKSLKANTSTARPRRIALTPDEREIVLAKTAGRCHVCGGQIVDSKWHADHVLAHSGGGVHSVDNYLPAHPTCNNYRWDYLDGEFQEILRLGVWLRTQIENDSPVGRAAAVAFSAYEKSRVRRRSRWP